MKLSYIVSLCEQFIEQHPELKTQDGALNQCSAMSTQLMKFFPEGRAHFASLTGTRNILPYRHPALADRPNPNPDYHHIVILADGQYFVDITYRQIDGSYPTPYRIQTEDEIREDWITIKVFRPLEQSWCQLMTAATERKYDHENQPSAEESATLS